MRVLHSVAILLLVLVMLPWGAYSGARVPASTAQKVSLEAFEDEVGDLIVEVAEARDERTALAVQKAKECRTASLPGSPCGPDVGLLSSSTSGPTSAPHDAKRPDGRLLSGLTPPGILDPPRSC
jgi:hypothetical protein